MATNYNQIEDERNFSLIRKHIAGSNGNSKKSYLVPKELFEKVKDRINFTDIYINGTGNIMYSKAGFPRSIGGIYETKEGYEIHFNPDKFATHPAKDKIDERIDSIVKKIEDVCGKCEYTPKNYSLEECLILDNKDLEVTLTNAQYNKFINELKQEESYSVHIPSTTNSSESRIILEGDSKNSLIGTVNRRGDSYKIIFSNKTCGKVLKVRNSVLTKAKKISIFDKPESEETIFNMPKNEYLARHFLTKPHK